MQVYTHISDHDLLFMLRADDELAFNEIFRRHWKVLYSHAYRRLKNAAQSEEIAQEVFANLWIKRKKQQIECLLPYLLSVVKYQVFMLYKRVERLPHFEEPLEDMAVATMQADSMFFAHELQDCIDTWLGTQPEKRREIFRLRYIEEYSTKEISEKLSISQKTVQNTLATALSSLKQSLGPGLITAITMMSLLNRK